MKGNRKAKILEVAAGHFSRHGYESTSLEDVAAEAGVTKPAIYYHFKDKSALYEAVLLGRLKRLADYVTQKTEKIDSPKERLTAYIEAFGHFLQENRCFAAILAHEFADGGVHLPESAAKELARTLRIVIETLESGVAAGTFRTDNPMVVQMMIVSSLIMHQTTSPLRRRVAAVSHEKNPNVEPDMDGVAHILADRILYGLCKEGS